jgi:hypothetical protein
MAYQQNGNSQQLQPQMNERPHQRFSWQMPPPEEAPAYEHVQQQQYHQQAPHHAPQQPHVSTNVEAQHRHFSYAQTPVEHEAYIHMSSQTAPPLPQVPQRTVQQTQSPYTPIDSRPQSTFNPLASAVPVQPQYQPQVGYASPSSYTHEEKAPISPISPRDGPRSLSFSPVSPNPPSHAFPQPTQPTQAPSAAVPQSNHARKMSNLNPIDTNVAKYQMPPIPPTPPSGNTASPLPHKAPITPLSPNSAMKDSSGNNRTSYAILSSRLQLDANQQSPRRLLTRLRAWSQRPRFRASPTRPNFASQHGICNQQRLESLALFVRPRPINLPHGSLLPLHPLRANILPAIPEIIQKRPHRHVGPFLHQRLVYADVAVLWAVVAFPHVPAHEDQAHV